MSVYGKRLNHEFLDPNMCFCAWLIGGSIGKAQKRLIDEGIFNPVSNEPPSRMGVWFSAKKSPMYAEFMRLRIEQGNLSERPSKEEFDQAMAEFKRCSLNYHAKFDAKAV
jgi:hypothetical protein